MPIIEPIRASMRMLSAAKGTSREKSVTQRAQGMATDIAEQPDVCPGDNRPEPHRPLPDVLPPAAPHPGLAPAKASAQPRPWRRSEASAQPPPWRRPKAKPPTDPEASVNWRQPSEQTDDTFHT